jgi:ribosome-associated protein
VRNASGKEQVIATVIEKLDAVEELDPKRNMEADAGSGDVAGGDVAGSDADSSQAEEKMRLICTAAAAIKAHDITVLDVRGQTIIADFFVMCSGTSITHIKSIVEGVQDRLREEARLRAKSEGDAQSYWMILDYSDVILHVFSEETREFYDLERLWSDAKMTEWPSESAADELTVPTPPGGAAFGGGASFGGASLGSTGAAD